MSGRLAMQVWESDLPPSLKATGTMEDAGGLLLVAQVRELAVLKGDVAIWRTFTSVALERLSELETEVIRLRRRNGLLLEQLRARREGTAA